MNNLSTYKGLVSAQTYLTSSILGLSLLTPSYSKPYSELKTTVHQSKNISPSVQKLSNSKTKKLEQEINSAKTHPKYTQNQLKCAESKGVAPSECTHSGHLIYPQNNTQKVHTTQKRDITSSQQICANELGVSIDECNSHGVFTNRTQIISDRILSILKQTSWTDVTPNMLSFLREERTDTILRTLTLFDSSIKTLKRYDFHGLTNLEILAFNINFIKRLPDHIFDDLRNLRHLHLSENQLIELPENLLNNLTQLNRLFLRDNQLTRLPKYLIKHSNQIEYISLHNNPLTISKELFLMFQNQNPNFKITYFDTFSNFESVAIEADNSSISIKTIQHFFEQEHKNIPTIYPSRMVTIQTNDSFTNEEKAYLCIYRNPNYDFCKNRTHLTLPTKTITETNEEDKNMVGIGIGITITILTLLALTGTSIALGIRLKKRYKENKRQQTNNIIKKVIPTQGLSSEVLISHIKSGTLETKHIVGLKSPSTGNTLLHEIAFKTPELLEQWVDEEKIKVKRDLGNKTPNHVDSYGNSVLHVLAKNKPKTIDKWIREEKITFRDLNSIKNQKNQSLMLYIEHVDSELYQSWQNKILNDKSMKTSTHSITQTYKEKIKEITHKLKQSTTTTTIIKTTKTLTNTETEKDTKETKETEKTEKTEKTEETESTKETETEKETKETKKTEETEETEVTKI